MDKGEKMRKPTIRASSVRWVIAIDEHVRRANIRGSLLRFMDVAADVLDGWAFRAELKDLVRRRFLEVIPQTQETREERARDQRLCGTSWSVNPTEKMIRTFWPDRVQP